MPGYNDPAHYSCIDISSILLAKRVRVGLAYRRALSLVAELVKERETDTCDSARTSGLMQHSHEPRGMRYCTLTSSPPTPRRRTARQTASHIVLASAISFRESESECIESYHPTMPARPALSGVHSIQARTRYGMREHKENAKVWLR